MTHDPEPPDRTDLHFVRGRGWTENDAEDFHVREERRKALRRLPDWPFQDESDEDYDHD